LEIQTIIWVNFLIYLISVHEHFDFFKGLESELEELTETHNYIPGIFTILILRF